MTIPDGTRVRRSKCQTCVFRPVEDGGIDLREGRHEEIRAYLLSGTNQMCHHDNDETICRGGRNFQLEIWARMGVIALPTDEALREAMRAAGVEARDHI
jgi:hypothetical protein